MFILEWYILDIIKNKIDKHLKEKIMTIQTQFIFDDEGKKIAAIIPIEEYDAYVRFSKEEDSDIPEWHKTLLDKRSDNYTKNPEHYKNIDELRKNINL